VEKWGRGGLADVDEDLSDGFGLGEERDERERFLAGWTDQREDFINPSEKSGPSGRPGGGGVGCPGLCPLWLESRGRGRCRERKRGPGSLSDEGIVLLGPFGDEGSEGRIGGEDAVVAVTVDAGRRQDGGQAVEELQGREAQRGPTGRVWFRQDVENLVGAAVDQVEPLECEGGPGTITNETLQSFAVGGLDADAAVEAKTASVLPAQHVLGVVGLQEAVTDHVAEDALSHRVLEALQELVGEGGSFVEAEVGFWMGGRILNRVALHLLEEPVHDADVVMEVRIEA
jgi:hypothetical protein